MRIGVISDTHRRVEEIINNFENKSFDLIIHLGDYIRDAEIIEEELNIKIVKVRGNSDIREIHAEDEIVKKIKGKKILITHGHKYNIKFTFDNLYYRAQELDVDLVLFGHTHKPFNEKIDNILFFNPGSPTHPRNISKGTYGIIDINEDIDAKIISIKKTP
ncbi:MAG: metallophosphoesterase [Bacillota bacterium]|nr:metallophosphoesterase [Bacillota bacterium]